jgi:TP901 family phage tail tape measure protein
MSSGAIKAGGVFVEIGADPRKFFSALNKVNKSIGNMGRSLSAGGGKLAAAGIGMAAPIAAAVRQGAAFESTLLNIRASTGATAAQIDQIKASSMAMSQALGVGPTEAAQGMLELLKAGMSLDSVLGGAGKTALEFAKVGEMDVAKAAVVMSDAMNVFKVSSDVAANALSSAADASSTSIAEMSEAFSMSSAVAGLAGQSIEDLSATLAILANAGVKGSDAGTSVKTMLMRLMAPADDAVGALDQLGLSVASFRGADGQMKPMVEIIGTLTQAMGGLDQTAKDDIFRRIFGADAIRAASILASEGVDGFTTMREAMASALPVSEKYKLVMSGLSGSFASVLAAMQRMAIAISDAVAPALAAVVPFVTGFIDGLTKLATDNKEAVAAFAKFAVAAIAVGSALVGLGISLQVTSFGFAGIGKAAAIALSPLTMLIGTVTGVGKSFTLAMPATLKLANTIGSSMLTASASVLSFAATAATGLARFVASVVMAGVASVANGVRSGAAWVASALPGVLTFVGGAVAGIASYIGAAAMAVAASVASAAAVAAAWLAPLAPFLLLAAAAVGVGVAVKQFGGQMGNALGGVGEMAGQAGAAISQSLGSAVADGIVVFGDLATTATTTFNGIYAAVAEGDLAGAMDILWLGLLAGWLRGVEALMGYVDPWVAAFQDVFTDLGANIYIVWDTLWTKVGNAFVATGAVLQGNIDVVINGVLASWDVLEAGIRKSWNYIKSFFTKGFNLKEENNKVDSEMTARARERQLARPGLGGRILEAQDKAKKADAALGVRTEGVLNDAQATKDGRQDTNRQRAADRRAGVEAAEGKLNDIVRGKSEARAKSGQANDLLSQIQGASKMEDIAGVGSLSDQFMTLRDLGRLTSEQESAIGDALDKAADKITGTRDSKSAGGMTDPAEVQDRLAASAKSTEVVGTFSSNLGGMGFGSNLAERTAKAAEETAKNTRKIGEEGAVAA